MVHAGRERPLAVDFCAQHSDALPDVRSHGGFAPVYVVCSALAVPQKLPSSQPNGRSSEGIAAFMQRDVSHCAYNSLLECQ